MNLQLLLEKFLKEKYAGKLNNTETRQKISYDLYRIARSFVKDAGWPEGFIDPYENVKVICDETNNNPKTIDEGKLFADIIIGENKVKVTI
jgi:hypothetical protein